MVTELKVERIIYEVNIVVDGRGEWNPREPIKLHTQSYSRPYMSCDLSPFRSRRAIIAQLLGLLGAVQQVGFWMPVK